MTLLREARGQDIVELGLEVQSAMKPRRDMEVEEASVC
jgi:hypothetical protein